MSSIMAERKHSRSANEIADYLLQFRAGKMIRSGRTVTADRRRGVLFMTHGQEGKVHFCWKDLQTNIVEDDFATVPLEFEFKRIEECTTARIYVLKEKSTYNRYFYWLQEGNPIRDDFLCLRVNELINNPPNPISTFQNIIDNLANWESFSSNEQTHPIDAQNLFAEAEATVELDSLSFIPEEGNEPVFETVLSNGLKVAVFIRQSNNTGEQCEREQFRGFIVAKPYQELLNTYCIEMAKAKPEVQNILLSTGTVRAAMTGDINVFREALESQLTNNEEIKNN